MAVTPAKELANWLGTGAATTTPASATAGYYIPAANVGGYLGAAGDTTITDDIRDFLHSVLSKSYETYSQPRSGTDNAPAGFTVTRGFVKQADGKYQIVYTVAINNIVNIPSNMMVVDALPTYA